MACAINPAIFWIRFKKPSVCFTLFVLASSVHLYAASCDQFYIHLCRWKITFDRKLLQATVRANKTGHFIWVASDSWGAKAYPVRDLELAAVNTITILPQRINLHGKLFQIDFLSHTLLGGKYFTLRSIHPFAGMRYVSGSAHTQANHICFHYIIACYFRYFSHNFL